MRQLWRGLLFGLGVVFGIAMTRPEMFEAVSSRLGSFSKWLREEDEAAWRRHAEISLEVEREARP
jgi:hypothetical protein